VREARKQALAILAEGTPESARKMMELVRSTDERVAVIATKEVLDRTLGKAGEGPQVADSSDGLVDVTHLSPEQREELSAALATIYRLTGRGPGGTP
jgi:hypothetical protein